MKNILITGGAGYIGSHVSEHFLKKGLKVFILDNLSSGYKLLINKKSKFYNCSINESNRVKEILNKNKIDSIIHLAANLDVNESLKKPKKYYNNNVKGTSILINSCKGTKVRNFIFSSTAAVYKDKIYKVKENTIKKPKNVYGKTKLKAEAIVKNLSKKYNLNYAILRYFNVVGASKSKKIGQINNYDLLFKNLSQTIIKSKPRINIYGNNYKTPDGTCIRDFIHVLDISDIHLKVLKKINNSNKSLILNCGYGKGNSVLDVIKTFQRVSNKKLKIIYKNRRKADLEQIIADNKKLLKILKWKPKYANLISTVKSCINWEKKIKYVNAKY